MIILRVGIAALWVLIGGTAFADCNPPPPGLTADDWFATCTDVINYNYQQNNYGMDYQTYVQTLYAMYIQAQNPQVQAGGGAPGPMVACSGEGATFCPTSGYLLTCSGGVWLTGAATC